MNHDNLFESIKENLNGRPGQPIVLGVCSALAGRFEQEPWVFRAAAIILGVFFTFATIAAYFVIGALLPETSQRTRGLFKGLCIWAGEIWDRCVEACRDLTGGRKHGNGSY